jgi:hypothetical protein
MPYEDLLGNDILNGGDVIEFSINYGNVPLFGPSREDIANAFGNVSGLKINSVNESLLTRIGSGGSTMWNVNATVMDPTLPTAGQMTADIYNAMNALFSSYSAAGFNLQVGTITRQSTWSKALGLGTSIVGDNSASTFQWSTSVGLIAIALIVVSAVYFLKGVRVG